jgi:hypothetical protein
MESHMVWTVLFKDKTSKKISTQYNDIVEAKEVAEYEAVTRGTWVTAIIKGNCENNTYFL